MKDVWFAKVVHCEDEKYPPAFDDDGEFIDYSIGDIAPILELPNGKLAYYKITNIKRKGGSDWLYSSDAYAYDLVFDHVR